jgi:hypothetical protein
MKSLHRETRWPFCIISTLGWHKLSTSNHYNKVYTGLSYKVLELIHQRIMLLWQIAGIDSRSTASVHI